MCGGRKKLSKSSGENSIPANAFLPDEINMSVPFHQLSGEVCAQGATTITLIVIVVLVVIGGVFQNNSSFYVRALGSFTNAFFVISSPLIGYATLD